MLKARRALLAALTVTYAIISSGVAEASPVTVRMQGTWNVQYQYLGGNPNVVPLTVPSSFEAMLLFDVGKASPWYVQVGTSYITEYGPPQMSSSVLSYGPANPFGYSNPSSFTLLSRHDYAVPPNPPAPFESYQFVNRDYVQIRDATRTENWSYGLEFHSGNRNISLAELKIATADEFLKILQQAQDDSTSFYTSFWNYTFETPPIYGPPVTYTGGIGLSGSARITSVSAIPEPSPIYLVLAALLPMALRSRLKVPTRLSRIIARHRIPD